MQNVHLDHAIRVAAPDGSEVALLANVAGGSMAQFTLAPGQVAAAVRHATVDEVWFVRSGTGAIWRRQPHEGGEGMVTDLVPGLSLAIVVGTAFQFRADASEPLTVIGVTMPPWPGEQEATIVDGPWTPTPGN